MLNLTKTDVFWSFALCWFNFLCFYTIFAIFQNLHLISFAYCGFAFFTYNMHVFSSTSMKFILIAYLTLKNCSKISVFRIFLFWVFFSFLRISTQFLNLVDLFKIVLSSLMYQWLSVLHVSVKRKSKIFHFIPFFYENKLFLAQKTVSNFFGSN